MGRDWYRDAAWWDALLLDFAQQDGLGLSAFCLSRGVKPSQLSYQQRKRERAASARGSFREYLLPDAGAGTAAERATGGGIRLHVGGVVIELTPGFADVASLRAVLSCCR